MRGEDRTRSDVAEVQLGIHRASRTDSLIESEDTGGNRALEAVNGGVAPDHFVVGGGSVGFDSFKGGVSVAGNFGTVFQKLRPPFLSAASGDDGISVQQNACLCQVAAEDDQNECGARDKAAACPFTGGGALSGKLNAVYDHKKERKHDGRDNRLCHKQLRVFHDLQEGDAALCLLRRPCGKEGTEKKQDVGQNHHTGTEQKIAAVGILQLADGHKTEKEDRHVEPARIIFGIKQRKGGIQDRNKGDDKTGKEHGLLPALPVCTKIRNGAGDGKARKKQRQGAVADLLACKQGSPPDKIRKHEEGLQNGKRRRRLGISHHVIAEKEVIQPGIAGDDIQHLHEEECGKA